MSRFKASKYRHATGSTVKREQWYVDLRPAVSSSDATVVAASAKHVAVAWESGTSIAVLRIDQVGKQKKEPSKIHAHSSQVYDLRFSPFNDNILASAADDGRIRLWEIPDEGLTSDLSNNLLDLLAHRRRAAAIRFNPSANQILASGGNDAQVALWDIESGNATQRSDVNGNVQGLTWNYNGSLLGLTTASNVISIWDPRSNAIVQTGESHKGVKPSRAVWLGPGDFLATTGFGQMRERQVSVWDARNLSRALVTKNIDSSTGILEPFFDVDTSLLYLAGIGDGNVRAFEVSDSAPYLTDLPVVVSDQPTKSAAMVPKRALNVMDCEINRLLKLTANSIAPIAFSVPRKSKVNFAADLFPNTAGAIPALSGSEWIGGATADPVLISLDPGAFGLTIAERETIRQEQEEAIQREREEEAARNKKELPKLNIVRSSKYRHVAGKLVQRNQFFENVKADNPSSESETIKCNEKWFAVPWTGTGGQVAVFDLKRPGRTPNVPGVIECGSASLDMDFNPFNPDILVTGLDNALVKIWKVPADLLNAKQNLREPVGQLKGHYSKVTMTKFNPYVSNLLATGSFDYTIKLWDVEQSQDVITVNGHPDSVTTIAWNYNGSLFATTCKDKQLRIVDPRNGGIVAAVADHPGSKGSRATWAGPDRLISVGFSRGSDRQFSIWDARNLNSPLGTTVVDTCSGLMTPYFDDGNSILYLFGKGDGTIPYYEIVDEAPYAHLLSKFQTSEPAVGVAVFHKTLVDVREVELLRVLKLTTTNVQTLGFFAPRTRKEFFQDDIFPPTAGTSPALNANQWFAGQTRDPVLVSLKPRDLVNLSEAPTVERKTKYDFDEEQRKRQNGPVSKEQVMNRFFDKVTSDWKEGESVTPQFATYDERNDQVAEDEWDD